jgi:hypothetical protein
MIKENLIAECIAIRGMVDWILVKEEEHADDKQRGVDARPPTAIAPLV